MKTTVIFDFDYTLADSSDGIVDCINHALQLMGELPRTRDACCATIGLSLADTFKALTGNDTATAAQVFQKHFVQRADQVMAAHSKVYPGVVEMLGRLSGSGHQLAIVSTKFAYRIRQILQPYGLVERFDTIIGAEDVSKYKPDPEGVHLARQRMTWPDWPTVFAGDSLIDAETARRAGIDFFAVTTGTTSAAQFRSYAPRAILDSIVEIEYHLI